MVSIMDSRDSIFIWMGFFILTVLCVDCSSAIISCYTCSSRNGSDINCEDPYNPAMSTYTEGCMVPKEGHIGRFPANFCVKIIGTTFDTGEKLVIRTCNLENMESQCGVFRFHEDTLRGCILTCDYDGCNGAATPGTMGVALTALLLLLKCLYGQLL